MTATSFSVKYKLNVNILGNSSLFQLWCIVKRHLQSKQSKIHARSSQFIGFYDKISSECFRPGQRRVSIKSGKATDGSLLKLYLSRKGVASLHPLVGGNFRPSNLQQVANEDVSITNYGTLPKAL